MSVGFTGTREGMTFLQKATFIKLIESLAEPGNNMFHHGDCVGADDHAATLAHESGSYSVTVHPPIDETHRAGNPYSTFMLEPKTHFARNRDIVDACDILIVCPLQMEHQSKGGTWYTHDYAVKKKKKVVIIWPDGSKSENVA